MYRSANVKIDGRVYRVGFSGSEAKSVEVLYRRRTFRDQFGTLVQRYIWHVDDAKALTPTVRRAIAAAQHALDI